MKKTFLAILFLTTINFAQSAGESGLSFLKLGFGARNIAMGDIGSVSAKDVTALNYNPALLSFLNDTEIAFTHNEGVQEVRSEMLGVGFRFLGLNLGLGVNTTSIPDIEVRYLPGDPLTTFDADYFNTSLSTGFNIADNISAGFTIKYLYEGLYTDEAMGWGFDFGAHYQSTIEGLSFGAVIRNLGSMDELRNEKTKLPKDLRLGSIYSFNVPGLYSDITAGAEFQKYLDTDDIHFNLGGEILYRNIIAARVGYQTNYELKGLTAGIGLKWGNLFFDYAFAPYNHSVGTAHTVSIKFIF